MTAESLTYRPVLLTKDGELAAIGELAEDALRPFAPVFAVHPPTTPRSTADHIDAVATKLAERVPGSAISLDTSFIDQDHDGSETHPLVRASEKVEATLGVGMVPVVSRAGGSSQAAAAAEVHRRHGAGVCVRLPVHDTAALHVAIDRLAQLVDDLAVEPAEVDLVLDCAEAKNADASAVHDLVVAAMEPDEDGTWWRSVTLSSSSFPNGVGGLPKNEITVLPRHDWHLWSEVARRVRSAGFEPPDYGDYGIAHPEPPRPLDGRVVKISAAIRYSTDQDWLVSKGEVHSGRGGLGRETVPPVARLLTEHSGFMGPDYSAGDQWISDVARQVVSPGGATAWRQAGTNHHITLVTKALANLGEP